MSAPDPSSLKAKIHRTDAPQSVRGGAGNLEHFAIDVEVKNERVLMDYYVARQDKG